MNNQNTTNDRNCTKLSETLKEMQQRLTDVDAKLDHVIKEGRNNRQIAPSTTQRTLDWAGFERNGGGEQ